MPSKTATITGRLQLSYSLPERISFSTFNSPILSVGIAYGFSDNITISDISEISYGLEDLDLQKHMVNFIYQNFQQQITLDEIAASVNVSRSKCCRLFQKYLNESPILFLKDYRLRKSCDLLLQSNYSITEIATMVGYNHLSYYSKIFLEKYGMTPHDYRKEKTDN